MFSVIRFANEVKRVVLINRVASLTTVLYVTAHSTLTSNFLSLLTNLMP